MKVAKHVIIAALNLYFEGLSVRKTQRQLKRLIGEEVNEATIWHWVQKYSKLVNAYVIKAHTPQTSGKWHEDETVIKCEGRDQWLWEMIDEDTKFLVATHLSGSRTFEDTVAVFQKGLDNTKQRPRAVFVDGSYVYQSAFNRVFYSRYKVDKVEFVQRVGIRARQTNNIVERVHETLKERTRPMRGLKTSETAKNILDGYVVNYNYVREHQTLGMTPAQKAGIEITNGWSELIEKATQHEAKVDRPIAQEVAPEIMVK
ncbi:MAG: IS6 family transposase [Nitrososphaerota archaeon]|nr:IS6 family transposase [Nitrososphaerota archaeon]